MRRAIARLYKSYHVLSLITLLAFISAIWSANSGVSLSRVGDTQSDASRGFALPCLLLTPRCTNIPCRSKEKLTLSVCPAFCLIFDLRLSTSFNSDRWLPVSCPRCTIGFNLPFVNVDADCFNPRKTFVRNLSTTWFVSFPSAAIASACA